MRMDWASGLRGRIAAITGPDPDSRLAGATLEALCDRLLSPASASAKLRTASEIHSRFDRMGDESKRAFLLLLAERYTADPERLALAIARYQLDPGGPQLADLHAASEPRRQQILRRLNEVPGGTAMLLAMRTALLRISRDAPGLAALDADFAHLFASWFNGGFLALRRLDWSTSGDVLAKLMRYEAVHAIESWEALQARLEPGDRRCYAFFHPTLDADPLIFVEVALTAAIPVSIQDILRTDRAPVEPGSATTAVFYSISNCQEGLRGIPFGGPLIKQVMDLLRRELPALKRAVTLSPLPGFARWLAAQPEEAGLVAALGEQDWHRDAALRQPLTQAAARYLLLAAGRDADPVARFHLGNGARVEQLDWLGDTSAKGLRQSHGMMVNYLYDPAHIDANCRDYAEQGTIAASKRVRQLARTMRMRR